MNLPAYVDFVKGNRTVEQAETVYAQRIADAREVFDKFGAGFQKRACPVCGGGEHTEQAKFHAQYGVAKCDQCTTQFVNPAPSLEALSYYYNHCKCNLQLAEILRSRVGTQNIILSDRTRFLIGLIKDMLNERSRVRVLEIGCSSGAFLAELQAGLVQENLRDRVELQGVDIDANAIATPAVEGVALHAASAEDFAKTNANVFDLVLHFELIEHLNDPHQFMLAVRDMLSEGGQCHFHTPNANGFDNVALGYNDFRPLAHGIFPPMHLQAFTPQNLLHFALRAGFKLKQIDTPGNFDVDIVRRFVDRTDPSMFSHIDTFSDAQLAVVQKWLTLLYASSHMRCTLQK